MKTEDLIVQLAASAEPVRPLASPMRRCVTWAMAAALVVLVPAAIIGLRADVRIALHSPTYLALAIVTLLTALLSATGAFVLSVPGAERTPVQHWLPIAAVIAWAGLLLGALMDGGRAMGRLTAFPFHTACAAEIFGLAVLPGLLLFLMLRRAAPLRLGWSAALGALAAVTLAATATQLICPIDDPAHHLVAHFGPALAFVALGSVAGRTRLAMRPHR